MREIGHLERCKLLLIITLALLLNVENAQELRSEGELRSGIKKLLNDDFDGARSTFQNLDVIDTSMLPSIFLLTTHILEREQAGVYYGTYEIDSTFTQLQDSCEVLLNKSPDRLDYNYCLALIKSVGAYWEVFRNNYIEAFADGFIASEYFKKCKMIDSTSTEYDAALGNFNYWSSVKTESLHWLPFVEDDREMGLVDLELCKNNEFLTAELLKFSLAWAYLNENKFDEARKLIFQLTARYPNSLRAQILLGEYYSNKDIKLSISTYKNLHEGRNLSQVREVEIGYRLFELYIENQDTSSAMNITEDLLSLEVNDEKVFSILDPILKDLVLVRDSILASKSALPKK